MCASALRQAFMVPSGGEVAKGRRDVAEQHRNAGSLPVSGCKYTLW
jgi:hypothetical protein